MHIAVKTSLALLLGATLSLECAHANENEASRDEISLIRDGAAGSRRKLRNLHVEYELHVVDEDGGQDHKLTIVEALDAAHHYQRCIHWYYRTLYNFDGRAEFDPLLNWFLWTPRYRLQLWESTRRGIVSDGRKEVLAFPYIQLFSSYLGIISPQHEAGELPGDYSALDYYLPDALYRDDWKVLSDGMPASIRTLVRETEAFVDALSMDVALGYAIRHREIRWKQGGEVLVVDCDDLKEKASGLWLPMIVRAKGSQPHSLELRAKHLEVNLPADAFFEGAFLPGTRVQDQITGRSFTLPGGEELLDFTIERMKVAASASHPRARITMGSEWVVGFLALAVITVYLGAGLYRQWIDRRCSRNVII